jgi:excisionase family DNA binding protein
MTHSIKITRKPGVPVEITEPSPRWWSIRGLADDWDVSQQTVRRLIKSGKLPAYRVGRQYRIRNADAVNLHIILIILSSDNTMILHSR